jgi:predicted nucleic acid-binding protein
MVEEGASDLAPLESELEGLADPRSKLEGLARVPPRWLSHGSARSWEFVGEYADGYGLWATAGQAFAEAAERPGADRPTLYARAAANYWLAGYKEAHSDFLARAEQLDDRNPQVVLAQLRPPRSPEERLTILAAAPDDLEPRPRAALDVARAVAHLELRQWDEVSACLDRVRDAVSDHIALRDLLPSLVVSLNIERNQQGRPVDVAALRAAAAESQALRDDLQAAFRFDESAHLLARAATALAIAGDLRDARELLMTIRDEERENQDARVALATAAIAAQDLAFAREIAPASDDEAALLLRAELQAASNDGDEVAEAVNTLDRLLVEAVDADIRTQAAFSRQVAAIDGRVDPSPAAEEILRVARPELDAVLRAQFLINQDNLDDAEAAVLPHTDDPRALRELARIAAIREDWPRVIELLDDVVERTRAAEDRLLRADALAKAGQVADSLEAFGALSGDDDLPREIRISAFSWSAQLASESFDHTTVERITREWLELDPGHVGAAWGRLFALYRLGRTQEAMQLIELFNLDPDPDREDLAELLVAVLSKGEPEAAARRMAEISDRFGRPEQIEAAFLITALRVRPEDRLEDLADQIRERLAEFPDRFPRSRLIQAFPIDTSPEGVETFFAEHIVPAAEQRQEFLQKVRDGQVPLASFATAVGRPLVLTTIQLTPGLPIGFRDPALDQLELESARGAIGRGVAWDPVSLGVVASLPPEIGGKMRPFFPGSAIAQATIDDLHRAVENPEARGADATLGYDPTSDQRFYRDYTPEEIEEERNLVNRAMEIAQAINVRPNIDATKSAELDELMRNESADETMLTWPASFALAERERMPIYSDDRFVRLQARRVGLQAFGTTALLDALVERKLLTEEERLQARQHLRRRGLVGVGVTLDELLTEGREVGWKHEQSRRLAFALTDPTAWNPAVILETVRMWGALLRTIFYEAPHEFDGWVARIIDAGKQNNPRVDYSFFAETLILIAWRPYADNSADFVRALIAAVRKMRLRFGWFRDPLVGVRARLMAIAEASNSPEVGLLFRAFLRDVSFTDQLAMLGLQL